MGINDRDYYRQVTRGSFFANGMTNVWQKIIIANVVVFAIQLMNDNATFFLNLDPIAVVFEGQVWRLVTYAFCHDTHGIWHILFNMFGVWIFGQAVEELYGSREFLLMYLTAAVVAGLAHLGLTFAVGGPPVGAVGASG